jgi:hypothetical protein
MDNNNLPPPGWRSPPDHPQSWQAIFLNIV